MCVRVIDSIASLNAAPLVREEDVPLNEQDKAWIRETIRDAHRQQGWGRIAKIFKDWGALGIAAGIAFFLLSQFGDYREFRGNVNARLTNIESQLTGIEEHLTKIDGALAPQAIKDASIHPDNPKSAAQVDQALNAATKAGITIDPAIVQEAGNKFIKASEQNPDAWQASLALLDYKTSKISIPLPNHPNIPRVTLYVFKVPKGLPPPEQSVYGTAPPQDEALMNHIGINQNAKLASGDAVILLRGGNFELDGMELRSVIFQGVTIHYRGSATIMRNVYFLNCTFVMENSPNSRALIEAALEPSPSVVFNSTSTHS